MSNFDPNWPHGHVTRDGRKVELMGKIKSRWLAVVTEPDGYKWRHGWSDDGLWHLALPNNENDLLNAPAPKRTWEVVAYEYTTGHGVFFLNAKNKPPKDAKIIGRYTLTEGEGMEEKEN